MKKIFLLAIVAALAAAAIWLYQTAQNQAGYYGLPAVACFDSTLPISQNFSVTIRLVANGKNIPLDANIGHDPGRCLRVIHTNDASGVVRVKSNDRQQYTLADFFNVWHKQFSAQEFMGYVVADGHRVAVAVNGVPVSTLEQTPLLAGETLTVIYQ